MIALISVLIIVCCILLTLVVLVQNPKGGGLSSAFGGGAQQMMGVQKTTDFLDKATWTLALVLAVLCLSTNFFVDRNTTATQESQIELTTPNTNIGGGDAGQQAPVTPEALDDIPNVEDAAPVEDNTEDSPE